MKTPCRRLKSASTGCLSVGVSAFLYVHQNDCISRHQSQSKQRFLFVALGSCIYQTTNCFVIIFVHILAFNMTNKFPEIQTVFQPTLNSKLLVKI